MAATDSVGNVGKTTCTVIVIPEDHNGCPGSKSSKSSRCTKSSPIYRRPLPPNYSLSSSSKGSKSEPFEPFEPTDILVQEYQDSRQRFLIGGTFEHVWDSAFDADSRLGTSAPTAAPTSGKGKGKGPKGPKSNKSILQRRKESKNDMAPVSAKSSRPEAREEASPPSSQTRNRKVAEFFSDVTFDLDDEEVVNFAIVGEGGGY